MPTFNDKQTPLLLSVVKGSYETFLFLLSELNCNFEISDSRKNNMLHYAVINKSMEILIKLIMIDSDYGNLRRMKNIQNKTPLDLGVEH